MYCTSCGAQLDDQAQFCPECGTPVKEGSQGSAAGLAASGPGVASQGKRKMALWKKVLIGIAAVIVLAIGLAMFATSGLIDPVDRHFSALREGNIQAAYEETSQAFRANTSLEDYTRFIEANPILSQITDHSFSQRAVENGIGTLSGKLTSSSGGVQPVEIKLVKENDEWKILGIDFSPDKKD